MIIHVEIIAAMNIEGTMTLLLPAARRGSSFSDRQLALCEAQSRVVLSSPGHNRLRRLRPGVQFNSRPAGLVQFFELNSQRWGQHVGNCQNLCVCCHPGNYAFVPRLQSNHLAWFLLIFTKTSGIFLLILAEIWRLFLLIFTNRICNFAA